MSEWISIEERKPPNNIYVLVAIYDARPKVNMYFIHIAERINDRWFEDHNGYEIDHTYGIVKYWQPLPDYPDN